MIKKIFTGWLVAALLFAGLFSCTQTSEIGLGTLPDQDKQGLTLVSGLEIESGTLLRDSVLTGNLGSIMAGRLMDPVFGNLEASGFLELRPNASLVGFPSNAIFDSMTVRLAVTYVYGDTAATQKIYVRQLADTLGISAKYRFTNKPLEAITLDTLSFRVADNDGTLTFRPDNLGRRMVSQGNSVFTDPTQFRSVFKGIAFLPDAANTALVRLDVSSAGARVRVHYHTPGDTVGTFILLNTSTDNQHYSRILSDRTSSSALSSLVRFGDKLPLAKSTERSFLQSGIGMTTVVRVGDSAIAKLKSLSQENIISRVILELHPVEKGIFTPPSGLLAVQYDGATGFYKNPSGLIQFVPNDNNLATSYFPGELINQSGFSTFFPIATEGNWEVNLTTYIRQIIAGQRSNTGMVIQTTALNTSVNRTIIAGPGYSNPSERMKLRVYLMKK